MVRLVGKKNRKDMMSMQESEEIKESTGSDDKTMSVSDLKLLKFYGPRIL
jgi:hypothetical protein